MNALTKFSFFSLIVVLFASFAFGQKSKVFSPDNTLISKSVIQERNIGKYIDGGAFRCGLNSKKDECNYDKIRKTIWNCWNEKKLCYLTVSWSGIDAGNVEHIFIEPNKNNQWLIVRRTESYHASSQFKKPIHNLAIVYTVAWQEKESENVLIFKNKFGRVIEEF